MYTSLLSLWSIYASIGEKKEREKENGRGKVVSVSRIHSKDLWKIDIPFERPVIYLSRASFFHRRLNVLLERIDERYVLCYSIEITDRRNGTRTKLCLCSFCR